MTRSTHRFLERQSVGQPEQFLSGKTFSLLSRLPAFYAAEDPNSLFFQLLNGWGQVLEQTEIDLFKVMQSHHVGTANNEGSQGFTSNQQGDLDRLFSLYLEALGGTSLLLQDKDQNQAPYRDRLLALIAVLRRGAATKQGIRDIVAANLGIFSDDPAAQAAKAQIQIEEYLPELISYSFVLHPRSPDPSLTPQTFQVVNPNVFPTAPAYKLELQDARPLANQTPLNPLVDPRFVNLETGEFFELKLMLRVNDVLRIQPDGTLLINGVEIPAQSLPLPLPLATSTWCIEFKVGELEGRYDETLYDFSRYDEVKTEPEPLNAEQSQQYLIALTVEITKITPGTFRIRIPWNIPGFTDQFSEREDHPRSQISAIINKVKAAGVMAVVDYEQPCREDHQMTDRLMIQKTLAPGIQGAAGDIFDSAPG